MREERLEELEITAPKTSKLLDFIMNLTEEEVDRIISELPQIALKIMSDDVE